VSGVERNVEIEGYMLSQNTPPSNIDRMFLYVLISGGSSEIYQRKISQAILG
jgi:hypothetical protein